MMRQDALLTVTARLPVRRLPLLLAALVAGPAAAQVESGRPPNQVEDVIVERGPLPKVESTFPAQNAVIAPGVLVLRVTYDQPMAADSWSYAPEPGVRFPECGKAPRQLEDQKSFLIICRLLPGESYGLWFNREGPQGESMNFTSPGRRPAAPYRLSFKTDASEPATTLAAALKRDPTLPPGSDPSEPIGMRARISSASAAPSAPTPRP
jgi:hypothetical protein